MITTKVCTKCKEELDVSCFSKHRNTPSGLQTYCKKCAHRIRVEWARDNTDKTRQHKIKYNYGITQKQYEDLLELQENKCHICRTAFGTKTPNIDHDHSCCSGTKSCGDCVRGLLCIRCNLFLGFYENYAFMSEVLDYLKK